MAEKINGYTELIGLTATPTRHSKLPKIHDEAFIKLRLDCTYLAFEVGNGELKDAVKGFKALKVRGYNVSMPNKTVIGQYLDRLSPTAELCGAVGAVVNDDGVLTGYIIDGIGYMRSLRDAGIEPAGRRVMIIGAGGATATIEIQTTLDGVKGISIFSRRDGFWECAEQNIRNINEKTSCKAMLFDLADTEALKREIEDGYLFANATDVGMRPLERQMAIPDASFLRRDLIATDVAYMPTETELLRVAEEVGCKMMDGLGMMLCQGVAVFKLWTGKEMLIDYMKEILGIES